MVRVWGRHLLLVILTTEGGKDPYGKKKRLELFSQDACCWSVDVLILSDYKLECFDVKSPTFVGLFMDKKSMMRNRVEN